MENTKKRYAAPSVVLCRTEDIIITSNELKWDTLRYAVPQEPSSEEPCSGESYNIS